VNLRARGAVLVETALFVSAALVFMLGTVQIGMLGFMQLTTDSAAYFDARANVLTVKAGTPEQNTNHAFPQIPASDITTAVVPAPTPSIPVDYGYNDPDPTVRANSAVSRHGGASMLQPAQEQATVAVPGIMQILGQSLGVTGVAIEPEWQECGTHFDIANVGCSLSNPPANSQTNYFTQGENTPPYLVGFDYMQQCALNQPWGIYTGPNAHTGANGMYAFNQSGYSTTGWAGPCAAGSNNGNSYIGYIAMGTAEYLDSSNWSDKATGAGGACDPLNGPNQSVFEAMAFHQRVYATIAEYLTENPYQANVEQQSQQWDPTLNPYNQYGSEKFLSQLGQPYNGLRGVGADSGNVATPEAVTSFKNWEGFDDATHGPALNDIYNAAVQTVYKWDIPVSAGQPPNDPTYNTPTGPEIGCYP
jgi:hypothetical protein